MRLKSGLLGLLLLLATPLFCEINDHREFQLWMFESISQKLSEKDTLYLQTEIRYGDNASKLYLGYVEILYKHDFTKLFSLVPAYRQQWAKGRAAQPFRPIYSPYFDAIFTFKGDRFILYDRSRTEYRIFEHRENQWVYRHRVYLTTAKAIGPVDAHPFIFDELFFVEDVGFEQNRFAVGLSWAPTKHFNPRLMYMVRHRKDLVRNWEYQNVLCMQLFLPF